MSQGLSIYGLEWTDNTYSKENFDKKYDESCSTIYLRS